MDCIATTTPHTAIVVCHRTARIYVCVFAIARRSRSSGAAGGGNVVIPLRSGNGRAEPDLAVRGLLVQDVDAGWWEGEGEDAGLFVPNK